MQAKYFNPFTDFGFKKLFGEEKSKPLLLSFLNALLPLDTPIVNLSFRNAEQLGSATEDRRAVYDIYCQDAAGNYFIVEMQKAYQKFFKDRALYYTTFPIQEQADKGTWSFELKAVFCVGLLDFVFDEDQDNPDYLHEIKLKNRHNNIFYDKYALYFIELPKFHKAESELASQLEDWVYLLKHLEEFAEIPKRFQHTVLEQAFEIAELANLTPDERAAYENSLKIYRDNVNVLNSAIEKALAEGEAIGEAKGRAEGRAELQEFTALNMIAEGFEDALIAKLTGLSIEAIQQLRKA